MFLISLVLLAPLANAVFLTTCLRMVNSTLTAYEAGIPCGVVTPNSNFETCCNPDSQCLQAGVCRFPGSAGGGFSTYYIGGCTDASYLDTSCSPNCKDQGRQDIVYNATTKTWACCGTESDGDTVNCDSPTNEKFNAPAPSALSATFTAGTVASTGAATSSSSLTTPQSSQTSSFLSTTPSSSATGTSPTSPAQSGPSNPTSGLSTGAKAGIGIAVSVGAILALVGAFLVFRKRRQRANEKREPIHTPKYAHNNNFRTQEVDGKSRARSELPAHDVHEMS